MNVISTAVHVGGPCPASAQQQRRPKVFSLLVKHFEDCWLLLLLLAGVREVYWQEQRAYSIYEQRCVLISSVGPFCFKEVQDGRGAEGGRWLGCCVMPWRCRIPIKWRMSNAPGVGLECTAIMNTARSLTLEN